MANVKRPSNQEVKDRTANIMGYGNNSVFKSNIENNKQGDDNTKKSTEKDRVDMYNIRNNQAAANSGSGDWKPKQATSDKDIADEQKRLGKIAAGSVATAAAIPAALTAAGALTAGGAAEAAEGAIAKKGAETVAKKGAETVAKKEAEELAEGAGTKASSKLGKLAKGAGKLAKGVGKEVLKEGGNFLKGAATAAGSQLGVSTPAFSNTNSKQASSTSLQDEESADDAATSSAQSAVSETSSSENTAKQASAQKSQAAKFQNPSAGSNASTVSNVNRTTSDNQFQNPKPQETAAERTKRFNDYWRN